MKQGTVSFQLHYVHIRLCYCVYIRHFFWNTVYLVEIGKANTFRSHHCLCLALGETWRGTEFLFAGLAFMLGEWVRAPIGKSSWAFWPHGGPVKDSTLLIWCPESSQEKYKQVRWTKPKPLPLIPRILPCTAHNSPTYTSLPPPRSPYTSHWLDPGCAFWRIQDRGRKKPFWL